MNVTFWRRALYAVCVPVDTPFRACGHIDLAAWKASKLPRSPLFHRHGTIVPSPWNHCSIAMEQRRKAEKVAAECGSGLPATIITSRLWQGQRVRALLYNAHWHECGWFGCHDSVCRKRVLIVCSRVYNLYFAYIFTSFGLNRFVIWILEDVIMM